MKNWIYLVVTMFVVACGGSGDNISKEERMGIIKDLENKSFGNMDHFDTSMAIALVNNYDKFALENPEDEMTPIFLFKAGDLCMALHKPQLAIGFFDKVIEGFPDFDKIPYCMFLKGFVYEDQLHDLDNAKVAYEAFIKKYPNHDMTDAARFSIRNLGKSPEELIRNFEKKTDSTQVES